MLFGDDGGGESLLVRGRLGGLPTTPLGSPSRVPSAEPSTVTNPMPLKMRYIGWRRTNANTTPPTTDKMPANSPPADRRACAGGDAGGSIGAATRFALFAAAVAARPAPRRGRSVARATAISGIDVPAMKRRRLAPIDSTDRSSVALV